ncbi:unnamed protein product, partial [Prorocentrum cordatum]
GRTYFGTRCVDGSFSNEDYLALNLLGKTFRYTVDLAGAGCGCNAALYLTSLHQNDQVSECEDYYCDANNVCGPPPAPHERVPFWLDSGFGSTTDSRRFGSALFWPPQPGGLRVTSAAFACMAAVLAGSAPSREGMDAPWTTVPRPSPVRYCGWCAGPLGRGESLALAEGGSLLEVCELCYIIGLIRQAAWRARLSVEERAALLDSARLLGALLSALAGLGLDGAEGAAAFPPVAPGLAAAAAVGRAAAAAPAGGGAGAPVVPGLAALPGLPGFGGGGAAGAPPAGGAVPDGGGAPPGGVGAALVGALAGGGGGPPGGPPPGAVPGAPAIPGVPIAVAGGPIAPAGGAQLGPLVDGPWRQAVILIGADWRRGVNLELSTFDAAGGISGTALFEVEEIGTTGPSGQYLSAQFRGASLAAEAMRLDGLFPPRGTGPAGLLHLRGQGPALCGEPAVPGRGVLHVEWLRLRSNRGFVEPWVRPSAFGGRGGGGALAGGAPAGGAAPDRLAAAAAARAQAATATPGRAGGGRGRRRPRSSSASRSDDDGESRFREAPSRGGSVRLLAEKRPGALYDEAMKNIGRVMGLREGADGSEVRAKVVGYLQAVVFGHHPPGQMRINTQRELQTLATALDLLECGCLADLSDVLMQRFKALELSLSDASWQVASELEIVPDAPPSLASMGEQDLARRAALLRRRLMDAKSRGALGGKGQGERSALRQRGQVAVSGGAEDASRTSPRLRRQRACSKVRREARPPRAAAAVAAGSTGAEAEPACGTDADCDGDPLAEWREWAGAASDLLREPFDVGPVLLNIVRQFPGSFGRFTRYSLEVKPREHPADMAGRLQRDLLPLPYPSITRSQIAQQGEDPLSDKEWEGRANAAQQAALVALGRRLLLATRAESALPPDLDWNVRLKDRKIGCGGDEISATHRLTLEQVLDGLPPPGVAASIEAADLATGFVREALLDPTLVLLPAALRRRAPTSARVWASLEEWHRIVRALHERGVVSAIPSSEIACRDGAPLLNGAFGVPKPRDEPVVCSDGERRPVLRLITNLIPSNACQECIVGDTPEMPTMSQLNGLVLTESEDLLWSGADRKAFFYVFRAPPVWWPYMVIGPPVPSELLGLKDGGATHICLRVIGMGWISAVGVTTHLHRNMLRRSASFPRGLPPSQEITRRRRLPFSVEKPCPPAWMVYIDNLEVAEVVSKSEATTLRGTVPELISEARACYAAAGSPGSPAKMASLTLWTLSKKRASMRLVRILLGRWVRVHCFRRPLAASFAYTWKWLGNPRAGGRFSVSVVEDLLMCLALSGLCVADLRLEVDPLVTASDASEAAGAVVYGYALSDRGRALAERRQRPANAACEEETALVTVFDGIGGGRRAFEILGLVPAVHLSFEVDPTAVRVARRSYPSTQHLGDVTEADPAALAALLRARGLNVARQGLDDPRAGLLDHMVRIVDGLRTAMPEASIDFLGENVASMPECDVLRLNQLFGRIPLEIEAGDVGWVRRPRLYWASWDLLPSFEAEPVVVRAKTQGVRRACKVALKAERPPLEEWLPPGAVCPGPAAGEPLPTFVRWAPRSQPRPRPAGIGECSAAELARWEAAGFASPPYQFRDKWCIHQADGRVEPPDATIREKLMGFPEGHTVPCMTSSQAKAEPAKYEALRRSLVGNTFQCEVVAWIISHRAVGAGLLVSVPSLGELHESARAWAGGRKLWAGDVTSLRCGRSEIDEGLRAKLDQAGGPIYVGRGSRRWGLAASRWGNPFTICPERSREDAVALFAGWIRTQPTFLQSLETLRGALLVCHCGPDQACHADILLAELAKRDVVEWREVDASRRIVMGLVMACHNNGADIRTDGASEALGKIFPRQEIDSGFWRWRKARQLVWDAAEHINVLECQGALMMIRWRARSVRRHQCVFLHLLDSMVNIGALSKHRSSSPQLNKVVRTFSAWELAMGARAVFGFTSSARNPADAPSRLRDGIKASTLARYRGAAQRFVDYLASNNLSLPFTWDDIDICLQDYLEHLWAEGATKGEANDTLSGVQHLLRTRRRYPGAWQLLTVWGRLEIPQRAPPMPAQVCTALAGWALSRGEVAFAAVLLVAFHLCLRAGEVLGLSGGVIFLKPCGRGVVSLPWTKTSCQKGAREQVTLDDPLVGAVVHMQLQRDSRLWPGTTRAFHDVFRAGLQQIGCRHLALSPCSLRRGGATHEFPLSGDLSKAPSSKKVSPLQTGPAAPAGAVALAAAFAVRAAAAAAPVGKKAPPKATCPDQLRIAGFEGAPKGAIVPQMSSRSYFASTCNAGKYNNTEYVRMPLLGKTLRYKMDVKGAGCGCNAAFYLTSMGHNEHESECFDYYCDANNVCGQTCAEIDIQEANMYAFHATLHGAKDAFGVAAGEGGGGPGWNGPRDWGKDDYGPDSKCIDTNFPYEVAVSFPTDESTGSLEAMWVSLSQDKGASPCRISLNLDSYDRMQEMTTELKRGMTPIVSYWADDDMLWLDGPGDDHAGLCPRDDKKKCAESVRFFDFSIADISDEDSPVPSSRPTEQKPASDVGAWNWEASDSTTASTPAQPPAMEPPGSESPPSSTMQTIGSLGWDSDDEGVATDLDRGSVVEGGQCVEFDNWRKAVVGGRAVQMSLGKAGYGVKTSWEHCRRLCVEDEKCKQVVFYKPSGACFGTTEAQGHDQDNMGGSNVDFISAQCNDACAEFNNWRKSEAGDEISLGKHKYGDVAEDWPTCRDWCAAEEKCKQVVYYRPERKCYGMSGTSDDDEDNMGGNNPNFVSAHCRQAGAAAGSELASLLHGMDTDDDIVVMQKKHAGLSGPAVPAEDSRRWLVACSGAAALAALAVCGVAAAGAKRRRHLHAATPMETLRRIASGGEVASADHGLLRVNFSAERLLEVGGQAPSKRGLPGVAEGAVVEMPPLCL